MYERNVRPGARRALHRGAGLGAVLLSLTAPAGAADGPVILKAPSDLAPGIAALPGVAAPAAEAERRINAALKRLDARALKAAQECKSEGGKDGYWERTVDTPMRGPRFLSYVISDSWSCGGPHPSSNTMAIVYDLTTGAPVDWTTLLPASLTGELALAEGPGGTKMVTLASKTLHALYLAGYRPRTGDLKADDADKECREVVAETYDGRPPAMMAWLDAKAGGLAVQFDLAHVVQACADTVVIPVAALRREGAKPLLAGALEAAHAQAAR
ncbi:hypothetical protein MRF4_09200 [Methylobacterium radiotolerans]|uniref:hypothetical protein n=1 Tax=Methylobacterium TaxID=407 RepID=UPI002F2D4CD7